MDESALNERRAEKGAERINEMQIEMEKTAEEVNFDQYQFSVAQKYDLTTQRYTYKKIKYIQDEVMLDLRWRVLGHFDDNKKLKPVHTTLILIVLLFFLRAFVHYTGQYIVLKIMSVPVTKF